MIKLNAVKVLSCIFALHLIGCADKGMNTSPKVDIDLDALSEQGRPAIVAEDGKTLLLKGSKLVALIDQKCADESKEGISNELRDHTPSDDQLIQKAFSFSLSENTELSQLKSQADEDPCVLQIGNDLPIQAFAVPNDQRFANQWQHNFMRTSQAYDYFYQPGVISQDVIVAIVDTGIDHNHEDLNANMWRSSQGSHGYNFIQNNSNASDDNGHGTHCAGLAGAVMNNRVGGSGVMGANIKLMAVKGLDSSGWGTTSQITNSINYAVQNGADVISLSLGSKGKNSVFERAIRTAIQEGVVVVSAAGNNNEQITDSNFYSPAGYAKDIEGFMSVGALQSNGTRSSFSNYSTTYVEIYAPGTSVLSTVRGNRYEYWNGTSMATPLVAGAAALAIAVKKSSGQAINPAEIERLVRQGTVSTSGLSGLQLANLATAVRGSVSSPAPTPSPTPAPTPTPEPTPTPAPAPTPVVGPSIDRVVLMNSSTGRDIRTLNLTDTIDLTQVGTSLSLRFEASTQAQSVRMVYGNSTRTDGSRPFTLSYSMGVGTHLITATAYTQSSARGTAGASIQLRLTVVRSSTSNPTPAPAPAPAPAPSTVASEILRLVNLERAKVGAPQVQLGQACGQLAQSHADDMAQNNFFSHTSPTQGTFQTRINRFGVQGSAGENIAWAQGWTPAQVMNMWMESTGHRNNILNANFRFIGIGHATTSSRNYYVQCFSSR